MSDFILVFGASGAPALIRVSAIISVVQDREYPDRRVIEYVAGDKLLTLFVQDSIDQILLNISKPPIGLDLPKVSDE